MGMEPQALEVHGVLFGRCAISEQADDLLRRVFSPVRRTDVKQTTCPYINPAATVVAAARKFQRVDHRRPAPLPSDRGRADGVKEHDEVPHKYTPHIALLPMLHLFGFALLGKAAQNS
jgi:hypothetical protein